MRKREYSSSSGTFEFEGCVVYSQFWQSLLTITDPGPRRVFLKALETLFFDKPLWCVYQFVSRTHGVSRDLLDHFKEDLRKAAEFWENDATRGFAPGLWDRFFVTKKLNVPLSADQFRLLNWYLLQISVGRIVPEMSPWRVLLTRKAVDAHYSEMWKRIEASNMKDLAQIMNSIGNESLNPTVRTPVNLLIGRLESDRMAPEIMKSLKALSKIGRIQVPRRKH